jgi:hypothetical protein
VNRRRRIDIAMLAFATIVLAVLAYAGQRAQQGPPVSTYSTYDTGPNGYRAWYETLRGAGVPVARFERVLALLDAPHGTLVFSTYAGDTSPIPIDAHDEAALRRFVSGGGRLVALDDDFEGALDVTPGAGTSTPSKARAAVVLARAELTAGVRRVAGPIDALFGFKQGRNRIPLLANASGIVAVAYPYGKGQVIAIAAPRLFGNGYIGNAGNLAFAYDVVAGHGPVYFDEYVHGYDSGMTMWQALPLPVKAAVLATIALVALALAGANVPFAPAVPPEPASERDSSAYVTAMASLMRRARAARAAVDVFVTDARRRARARGADPQTAQAVVELESLATLARPTDAQLVRAAVLDYSVRKERA